ncbi:tetratricopeptide repeat protein, partial [Halarcobacter ebronensis]
CNKDTYTTQDLDTYNQLIKDGEIQGYNCIGLYYMRAKDYDKAEEYFNKGKDKGSIESYAQLGSLYSSFLNDKEKAIEYYTIAANKGHGKAAHNLGVIYDKRFNFKEAIKWYEKSFEKGDTFSLLAIGHIYRKQK